jgi:hypothetical protein
MKQTAVEWLHIEFQKRFPKETTQMYNNNQLEYEDLIQQAKEMEKDQIINAYAKGYIESELINKGAEQHYNETFKK